MIRKLKNIVSLFLLFVLISPTIIKLEHHHEHFFCHAANEKHFHNHHEKCLICSFEFSIFLNEKPELTGSETELTDNYQYKPYSFKYTRDHRFSFLLRGPPSREI